MRIAGLIIGIVVLVVGLALTVWTWYRASFKGQIDEASAYAGPVCIVLGGLRMFRAAAVIPLQSLARIAVVGVAILIGYGNSALIKAIFPQDQVLTTTTTH